MPDITEPNEPPLPVQPFVPGKRMKSLLKPPGPVRRGLVRMPVWVIAMVLCLPALVTAAFADAPRPLVWSCDVLLLAALLLSLKFQPFWGVILL